VIFGPFVETDGDDLDCRDVTHADIAEGIGTIGAPAVQLMRPGPNPCSEVPGRLWHSRAALAETGGSRR
jgi:hypothetical protein